MHFVAPGSGRRWLACLPPALITLLFCGGCGSPEHAATPGRADREIWETMYLQGVRAGYAHTTIVPERRDGRDVLKIDCLNHLVVKRFGEAFEAETRFTSIETPDGRLLEFQSEVPQGQTPLHVAGRVQGGKLLLRLTTQGKTVEKPLSWSDEYGGPYALQLSLLKAPMRPGETRTIRAFDPGVNGLTTTVLAARDYESVDLPSGRQDLLAVDTQTTLAGQTMPGRLWMDRTGDVLKQRLEALGMETVRAGKAEALGGDKQAAFDLGSGVVVPVNRAIPSPHQTRRIRYRVKLKDDDPSKLFASCLSQRVQSIDPETAEVTVFAVRPDSTDVNTDAPDDPPGDDDRRPNSLIESDDPAVVALAREAAGSEKDPWKKALSLERYVHDHMTRVDFSQAFATAAEVAKNRVGDCTEHAVLLAALARAQEIPARVAIGLVYFDRGFAYHMWTEVSIGSRWIGLDATLGQGGVGAAHLKIAQSNLKGVSPFSSFVPVLQVIGRLSIDVEEVEGGTP